MFGRFPPSIRRIAYLRLVSGAFVVWVDSYLVTGGLRILAYYTAGLYRLGSFKHGPSYLISEDSHTPTQRFGDFLLSNTDGGLEITDRRGLANTDWRLLGNDIRLVNND